MFTFCFAYSYKDASKKTDLCHKKSFNLNPNIGYRLKPVNKYPCMQVQRSLGLYLNLDGLERKDFVWVIPDNPSEREREREKYIYLLG